MSCQRSPPGDRSTRCGGAVAEPAGRTPRPGDRGAWRSCRRDSNPRLPFSSSSQSAGPSLPPRVSDGYRRWTSASLPVARRPPQPLDRWRTSGTGILPPPPTTSSSPSCSAPSPPEGKGQRSGAVDAAEAFLERPRSLPRRFTASASSSCTLPPPGGDPGEGGTPAGERPGRAVRPAPYLRSLSEPWAAKEAAGSDRRAPLGGGPFISNTLSSWHPRRRGLTPRLSVWAEPPGPDRTLPGNIST